MWYATAIKKRFVCADVLGVVLRSCVCNSSDACSFASDFGRDTSSTTQIHMMLPWFIASLTLCAANVHGLQEEDQSAVLSLLQLSAHTNPHTALKVKYSSLDAILKNLADKSCSVVEGAIANGQDMNVVKNAAKNLSVSTELEERVASEAAEEAQEVSDSLEQGYMNQTTQAPTSILATKGFKVMLEVVVIASIEAATKVLAPNGKMPTKPPSKELIKKARDAALKVATAIIKNEIAALAMVVAQKAGELAGQATEIAGQASGKNAFQTQIAKVVMKNVVENQVKKLENKALKSAHVTK